MNKNIEKEYKVLVNEEQFHYLLKSYPNITFNKQINTYYDTREHSIEHKKGAMRIREVEGTFIFTLKMHSSKGLLEFEKEVDGNHETFLNDPDILKLLESYHIYPPFIKLTELTTYRAMYYTGEAELCFDKSLYNGITDYEIEYEYKHDHDGLQAFQKILKPLQITYKDNCKSKIKRALDSL